MFDQLKGIDQSKDSGQQGFLNQRVDQAAVSVSAAPIDPLTLAESLLGYPLHPGQRQLLAPNVTRAILACSRQWGKSTIAALKATLQAHTRLSQTILIGSPSGRQSRELLNKAHGFLRKLDPKLSRNTDTLTASNGSRIIALPHKPDNIRGYSADLVILDEAARIDDEYFTAILPAMAARPEAPLFLLSTPAGRRGYFHQAWHDKKSNWLRILGPASDTPHLNQDFLTEERRSLHPDIYEQEYECAFGDSEVSVFPASSIEAMHDPSIPPLELNIYNRDDAQKYLLGLDFGKQRSHSAYVVLERGNRVGPRYDKYTRMRPWRPTLRIRLIKRFPLGTEYSKVIYDIWQLLQPPLLRDRTYIAYDATGVGIALQESLHQAKLFAELLPCTIVAQSERKPDFYTEVIGKSDLVGFLRLMLESKYLVVNPALPLAAELMEELQNFEQSRSHAGNRLYRGRSSGHDDLVLALSLAVWKAYCLYEEHWRSKVIAPYIAYNEVWNGRHDQF